MVSGKISKYDKDAPFSDPVVRCDSCSRILLATKIREMGCCVCGSRKVRNLLAYTEKEAETLLNWGIDPNFLALFEGVDSTGVSGA